MNSKQVLTLLLVVLGSCQSWNAQIVSSEHPWINTDTVLTEKALINRRALLTFNWNAQSTRLIDLGEEIKKLQQEFPWLNAVGIHRPGSHSERSIPFVKRSSNRLNLNFPIQVDLSSKLTEDLRIRFNLYGPGGRMILKDQSFSPSGINSLRSSLKKLYKDHQGPGKVMFSAMRNPIPPSLNNLNILQNPYALRRDDIFEQLFISETGNNRIIILSENGEVIESIGSTDKGTSLGNFEETLLDRPMGLAHYPDSSTLFIADYGNKRIVRANTESLNCKEFKFSDSDGYDISLPAGPTDLNLEGQILTITIPEARQIWMVNILTRQITKTIGNDSEAPVFDKRLRKLILGNPNAALTLNERVLLLDRELGNTYKIDEPRVVPLKSRSQELYNGFGGELDTIHTHTSTLRAHDGYVYELDGPTGFIYEINIDSDKLSPWYWNTDSLKTGYLADICWSKNEVFLLDSEYGQIIKLGKGYSDFLRLSKIERLRKGRMYVDQTYVVDQIQIDSSSQSLISIKLNLPDSIILHPDHPSDFFKMAGSELYAQNLDPSQGNLELIAMPDTKENQFNIMGEVFLTEIGAPWKIYTRMIQISIPVSKNRGNDNSDFEFSFDLLEGVSPSD